MLPPLNTGIYTSTSSFSLEGEGWDEGDINGQVISCMFLSRQQIVLRIKKKLSTHMAGQSEPGQLIHTDRSWCYSRLPVTFSLLKSKMITSFLDFMVKYLAENEAWLNTDFNL